MNAPFKSLQTSRGAFSTPNFTKQASTHLAKPKYHQAQQGKLKAAFGTMQNTAINRPVRQNIKKALENKLGRGYDKSTLAKSNVRLNPCNTKATKYRAIMRFFCAHNSRTIASMVGLNVDDIFLPLPLNGVHLDMLNVRSHHPILLNPVRGESQSKENITVTSPKTGQGLVHPESALKKPKYRFILYVNRELIGRYNALIDVLHDARQHKHPLNKILIQSINCVTGKHHYIHMNGDPQYAYKAFLAGGAAS